MAQITIRQIPDEVHRALKAQAQAQVQGKSAEALARTILQRGLFPADRVRPGDLLRSIWKDADLEDVSFERDRSPIDAASFE
ncbi:MAG: plasmid stabilization protein [Gammaproteobacteria bacterium]|nr:plasmid stabilization protein [Gammaproteobacteria bacterium]MYH45338.1 plasmid stabilization protein [Gammaproteobacteria bacterium]MYL14217.1 plasmid stabilization protein [Gammaproteobacteria bacterium]